MLGVDVTFSDVGVLRSSTKNGRASSSYWWGLN